MKKAIALAVLTLFIVSSATVFAADEGSKKICPLMGEGKMSKGMMMHKMKMMSMMKEMQGMMMDMMGMMKECKGMKDDQTMMEKMDHMMARCKEMVEESDDMMSECMKMKKGMMGEEDTEESLEMPSGHESHH